MKRYLSILLAFLMMLTPIVSCVFAEEEAPAVIEEPPAPPHSHSYGVVGKADPSCTADGYVAYGCSCGDSYSETLKATGHSFNNGACSVCGAADPDYQPPRPEPVEETPAEETPTEDAPETPNAEEPEQENEPNENTDPEQETTGDPEETEGSGENEEELTDLPEEEISLLDDEAAEQVTVTWQNPDETPLYQTKVDKNTVPVYGGDQPMYNVTGKVCVFTGWDKTIEAVTEDTVYTAVYSKWDSSVYTLVKTYHCDYANGAALEITYWPVPFADPVPAQDFAKTVEGYKFAMAGCPMFTVKKDVLNEVYLYYLPESANAKNVNIAEKNIVSAEDEITPAIDSSGSINYTWYSVTEDGTRTKIGEGSPYTPSEAANKFIICEAKKDGKVIGVTKTAAYVYKAEITLSEDGTLTVDYTAPAGSREDALVYSWTASGSSDTKTYTLTDADIDNELICSITDNDCNYGTAYAKITVHTIESTSTGNGIVEPRGKVYVLDGTKEQKIEFSVVDPDKDRLVKLKIDDKVVKIIEPMKEYTFPKTIEESHTVEAVFTSTINFNLDRGTGKLTAKTQRDDVTFEWTISDETSKGKTSVDTKSHLNEEITCKLIDSDGDEVGSAKTKVYTVKADITNGTITPAGSQSGKAKATYYYLENENATFTLKGTDSTYKISSLTVDGSPVSVASKTKYPYAFNSLTASHKISVTFAKSTTNNGTPSGSNGASGTISEDESTEPSTDPDDDILMTGIEYNDPAYTAVPDAYKMGKETGSTVERVEYATEDGEQYHALVYVPAGYSANEKYDILYIVPDENETPEDIIGLNDDRTELRNVLDHMIDDGSLKPMMVAVLSVKPEAYDPETGLSVEELVSLLPETWEKAAIPAIEGKYSTYADLDDEEGLAESRDHRAISGFGAGAASTWYAFTSKLNLTSTFVPISGSAWSLGKPDPDDATEEAQDPSVIKLSAIPEEDKTRASTIAKELADALFDSDYWTEDFFIFALSGEKDPQLRYMSAQIAAMHEQQKTSFLFGSERRFANISYSVVKDMAHDSAQLAMCYMKLLPKLWKDDTDGSNWDGGYQFGSGSNATASGLPDISDMPDISSANGTPEIPAEVLEAMMNNAQQT